MEIRRMRKDEVDALVRLWRRAREDSQPWLEARMGHTAEEDFGVFEGRIAKEHDVWVADDGRPVGFLAIEGKSVGFLYVDPTAQRRGIGTSLLDHAKSLSPSGLTLFTHQRNERARSFYERRGFRAIRFGVSPPPESEPDVLYEWEPPSPPRPLSSGAV